MKKRINKFGFLTLYRTQKDKLISYGWRSSSPFISKLDKLEITDEHSIKIKKILYRDYYFDKFSKP